MGKVVLVGLGVTLGALVIQALAGGLGAEAVGVLLTRRSVGASLWRNSLATIMLIVVLLVGHMAQVAVWATVFTSTGSWGSSRSRFTTRDARQARARLECDASEGSPLLQDVATDAKNERHPELRVYPTVD